MEASPLAGETNWMETKIESLFSDFSNELPTRWGN